VARTDFDHGTIADGTECVGDGVARRVVDQEMLSELGRALQRENSIVAGWKTRQPAR
jgi:hypothetical protein